MKLRLISALTFALAVIPSSHAADILDQAVGYYTNGDTSEPFDLAIVKRGDSYFADFGGSFETHCQGELAYSKDSPGAPAKTSEAVVEIGIDFDHPNCVSHYDRQSVEPMDRAVLHLSPSIGYAEVQLFRTAKDFALDYPELQSVMNRK